MRKSSIKPTDEDTKKEYVYLVPSTQKKEEEDAGICLVFLFIVFFLMLFISIPSAGYYGVYRLSYNHYSCCI